jgi:hypothetical protein
MGQLAISARKLVPYLCGVIVLTIWRYYGIAEQDRIKSSLRSVQSLFPYFGRLTAGYWGELEL